MRFDPDQLLLSKRRIHLTTDPFCFFHIDDYLPADFFEALLGNYPSVSTYRVDSDGKLGFRSSEDPEEVQRYCDANPDWRELTAFFGSDAFLADARETFARPLKEARGLAARRPWLNCTRRAVPRNWLRYQVREPVRTTFQFSLLPREAAVVPHSDAPRKLVSLLLYFQDRDWEDAWGGGTEFYAPLDRERARTWGATDRIPFEEFKSVGTTSFRANRLAGFVRCAHSYHGVPPIACPPGHTRKALLINIKRVKWSKRDEL